MSFNLQLGYVGNKERFVAKRYIENTYKKYDDETRLFVEKTHQGYVRGQYFKDIEELLNDVEYIFEYASFDDYVIQNCDLDGYIDILIMDNINDNLTNKNFSFDELKDIVKKYGKSEIVEALMKLKSNEKLYVLINNNVEYISTDKNSLIIDNLKDGQYQRVYSNADEILEAIESDDELATVFICNEMSKNERSNYLDEYKNEN